MVAMKETYSDSQFPVRLLICAIYSKTRNRERLSRASLERVKNYVVFVLACYLLNHDYFLKDGLFSQLIMTNYPHSS